MNDVGTVHVKCMHKYTNPHVYFSTAAVCTYNLHYLTCTVYIG